MTSDCATEAQAKWQEAIPVKPADATCHVNVDDTYLLFGREQGANSYRCPIEFDPETLRREAEALITAR